jgi:hypothetical protein
LRPPSRSHLHPPGLPALVTRPTHSTSLTQSRSNIRVPVLFAYALNLSLKLLVRLFNRLLNRLNHHPVYLCTYATCPHRAMQFYFDLLHSKIFMTIWLLLPWMGTASSPRPAFFMTLVTQSNWPLRIE